MKLWKGSLGIKRIRPFHPHPLNSEIMMTCVIISVKCDMTCNSNVTCTYFSDETDCLQARLDRRIAVVLTDEILELGYTVHMRSELRYSNIRGKGFCLFVWVVGWLPIPNYHILLSYMLNSSLSLLNLHHADQFVEL